MKKLLSLLSIVLLGLLLVGCMDKKPSTPVEETPVEETPVEETPVEYEVKVIDLLEGITLKELYTIEINTKDFSMFALETKSKSKYDNHYPVYLKDLKIDGEILDIYQMLVGYKSANKFTGVKNNISFTNAYISNPKDIDIMKDVAYAISANSSDGLLKFDVSNIETINLSYMLTGASALNNLEYIRIVLK